MTLILTSALLLAAAAGCGGDNDSTTGGSATSTLPTGTEPTELDPANFTTEIDNPYFPIAPGTQLVYRETDAEGAKRRVVVTVTNDTKTIAGIEARVVHDVVSEDGQTVEDTFDWYAQDSDGNLWYLGEDTKEYENGKVKTTAGSWEAGVDGAQPGIIVPAHPAAGMTYREEYYAGEAEDGAEILTLGAHVAVPYGAFDDMLQTRNFSPLEPDLVEEKFYAKGIGPVLEVTVTGGSDRSELLRVTRGS